MERNQTFSINPTKTVGKKVNIRVILIVSTARQRLFFPVLVVLLLVLISPKMAFIFQTAKSVLFELNSSKRVGDLLCNNLKLGRTFYTFFKLLYVISQEVE